MKNAFHIPEAAMASPVILAARASNPGVQQAIDAMVSAMLPIVGLTVLMGFVSLVLTLLLRRVGRAGRTSWEGPFKGWLGEAMTRWFVLDRLDPREYRVFHDLYVPRADGVGTSQIDHVVVSRFGVFVIETKNLGGWIAGRENEKLWTQKNGRQTRKIQNPLIQNRGHVRALGDFLDFDGSAFIPVVWMIGDARMKEPVPAGVVRGGLKGFLRGHQRALLAPEAVETAVARLAALEHRTDRKRAKREHVAAIQMRRSGA
jgi:hypothetical protein